METVLKERKNELEDIKMFLKSSENNMKKLLAQIGWTEDSIRKDEIKVQCPNNKNHWLPAKLLNMHLEKCGLKMQGYDLNEPLLSEPVPKSPFSIKLDHMKKIEVLTNARNQIKFGFKTAWNGVDPDPQNSERLFTTYSTDERKALYDFCVSNTAKPEVPPEFSLYSNETGGEEERHMTFEQLKAKSRDAKRRRVKYKQVHTNRKSHTEVIKEVIENQMEAYKDWIISKEPAYFDQQAEQNREYSIESTIENLSDSMEHHRPTSSISRHSSSSRTSRSMDKRKESSSRRDYTERSEDIEKHRRHLEEEKGHKRQYGDQIDDYEYKNYKEYDQYEEKYNSKECDKYEDSFEHYREREYRDYNNDYGKKRKFHETNEYYEDKEKERYYKKERTSHKGHDDRRKRDHHREFDRSRREEKNDRYRNEEYRDRNKSEKDKYYDRR